MKRIIRNNGKISAITSALLEVAAVALGISGITVTEWWHTILVLFAVVALYGLLFFIVSISLNLYDKFFLRVNYQIYVPNHMKALQEFSEKVEIRFLLLSHPSDPIFTKLERKYIYKLAENAYNKARTILDDIKNGLSHYECSEDEIEQVGNYMVYFCKIMEKCAEE